MQRLHNILRNIFKDTEIDQGTAVLSLRKKWPSIVGQPVAVHTWPDTVRNRIITILVDTPQWMHHLSFFTAEIRAKLAPYDIADIRFRLGRIPEAEGRTEKEEETALSDEDARYLENTLREIGDSGIREKFRSLITHGLTKGRPGKKASP